MEEGGRLRGGCCGEEKRGVGPGKGIPGTAGLEGTRGLDSIGGTREHTCV